MKTEHEAAAIEELRELAGALRPLEAPGRVEQALREAFRRRQRRRRRIVVPLAAAAVIALAVLNLLPRPEGPRAEGAPPETIATDYMPVGFGRPLYPGEFVQVVRISVPRMEMVRFGLPVFEDGAEGRVQADVVLGEDGIARAIRFVQH
ncbi:MAG: hypothetical protein KIT09_11190 [Bryobacteraceae bacterium]|nr:hypothetical protein [Bryobacteraceae bacterium]